MTLTAYSISEEKELDVTQVLATLGIRNGIPGVISVEAIPEAWQSHMRIDLECPSCFVKGANIVKEAVSRSSGKAVRQACFRFVSPTHHPHCDFASSDRANAAPENLIAFGAANSKLTRAVRELVCTGIQSGAFNQRSIRDMREWFFRKKVDASFKVILDPRLPRWLHMLRRTTAFSFGLLPGGVSLTSQVASMPGFDWRAEASRRQKLRHKEVLGLLERERVWLADAGRVESLAQRYQGQTVFDPTVLADEYRKSVSLAAFISRNYGPISECIRNDSIATGVLALSALLLFVNEWELQRAIATFARIAAVAGSSDQSLGNVMGLNPFHDYAAWDILKRLQALEIALPDNADSKAELKEIELEIRLQFQTSEVS